MLVSCTNKGCNQLTEAKLDRGTNKVMCADCGQEIENITDNMKRVLDSQGQVIRTQTKAYQVLCTNCNKKCDVKIVDQKPFCSLCDGELKLSDTFLNMVMTMRNQENQEKGENE